MSDTPSSTPKTGSPGGDEMLSALFAQLVMQQANMAMMLLGKTNHPQTGETVKDLEAARLFIDQLEMLEVKTKGNLSKEESALLKQTLMSLRLAFVEAVEAPPAAAPQTPTTPKAQPEGSAAPPAPEAAASAASDDEHRKKFSKKY